MVYSVNITLVRKCAQTVWDKMHRKTQQMSTHTDKNTQIYIQIYGGTY